MARHATRPTRTPAPLSRSTPFDQWPEFLTVAELKTVLNLSRTSAYQLARAHGQHFGRLLRVPKSALRQVA